MRIDARHDVSFYEERGALERCIVRYAVEGLLADETVVLIVRASSLSKVRDALAVSGVDVDEMGRRGVLVLFDADATLASVKTGKGIDWSAVAALAGRVVANAMDTGRPVRLFGEMVAILWERGDVRQAMDLERLWHGLSHEHGFDVLCAYPSVATTLPGAAVTMNAMCGMHDATVSIDDWRRHIFLASYACETAAVTAARRCLRDMWAPTTNADRLDDALLIVSELAANAVQHARTPFSVEAQRDRDLARVIVRDSSALQPVMRHSDPTAPGGRGLALVNVLAHSWGVTRTPDGKKVWATIKTT